MTNTDSAEPRQTAARILEPSRILLAGDSCAVVNKIAGEAVEGAAPGMGDLPRMLAAALASAASAAAAGGPAPPDALPVPVAAHRLDVPVSGCVVFARTRSALAFLNAAFAGDAAFAGGAGTVEKRYWAIVEAAETPLPESGELIHWIAWNPQNNKSTAHDQPGPGRKKAVLRYRLTGRGRNYRFLEIELITGRRHQIRAQLARIGLRVKGDLKYGARRSEPNGGIRLHARSISFPDPAGGGKRITVTAEPPLRDNLWLAFEEAAGVTACGAASACGAADAEN
jgi:23S rRNA pseudouridine1911/1915/1917 synthase